MRRIGAEAVVHCVQFHVLRVQYSHIDWRECALKENKEVVWFQTVLA